MSNTLNNFNDYGTNREGQLPLPINSSVPYTPKYKRSAKTERWLEQIEREQYAFELILDPKYEGWLRRRAFIRSGHHTLRIEGNILTEEQVEEVLDTPSGDSEGDKHSQDVRNWNQAMQFVDSISANHDVPITPLLIRHIHSLIIGSSDRINFPGEYRRGEAWVKHPVTRRPVYRVPAAGDVPDLMYQFGLWLSNGASSINAVLSAGIAHLRLVEIHPFVDGNGRTARALTTLMLQRRGYSFNRMLALERYFDLDLVKYCEAISTTVGEHYEEGRDLSGWLEYFTLVLSVEISLAIDDVVDLRRKMEKWHATLSEKGYHERHRDILAYASINGAIRPRNVIKFSGVSAVTASTDLRKLVEAGILEAQGYGRARIYKIAKTIMQKM